MRTINKEEIIGNLGHVIVLMGGDSTEREISLLSGQAVYDSLQRLGINSSLIDVCDTIVADLNQAKPDLVFNMLHGKGGEDGTIQGMLEIMKVPYTGSGVLSSALAMDKVVSKLLWQKIGLGTADFVTLNAKTDWQSVIEKLGQAVVKPVSGGSSLGIAIAKNASSLEQNYKEAVKFDSAVMAEKCIEGEEYSVGILGDQLLPLIQLRTKREFFDYDAKYVDEDTEIICPPRLSAQKKEELQDLVRAAYESLSCKGLARVDVMQDEAGKFYLLEVNTVPGMTSHSFVPMSAQRIGIDFDELLLRILEVEMVDNKK
jgi:D-alanine-D-alanine ligase|tara:strand:+ start:224 stop:1168 length:945 start_codon:yes stop_codon:yes gene_type:complete